MQKVRVRVQDPSGRPGFYAAAYGTNEGYVEDDGRSRAGLPDRMVHFDSGKSGTVPSGRIVFVKNDQPKAEIHPAQTKQHTFHCDTLQDAYLQAQRWNDQGLTGINIRQLLTPGAETPMGWYVTCGKPGLQAA